MPGAEIVSDISGRVKSGSAIMPPENTSWKISTKGMTVMAAVVLWARVEIQRAIISAAKVIRNTEKPNSTRNHFVNSGLHRSKRRPTSFSTYSVTPVCSRHSMA